MLLSEADVGMDVGAAAGTGVAAVDEAGIGPVGGRTDDRATGAVPAGAGAVAGAGREDGSADAEGLMVPDTVTLANAGSEGIDAEVGTDDAADSTRGALVAKSMSMAPGWLPVLTSSAWAVGDDMMPR